MQARIEKSLFGTLPDGRAVHNWTLFDEKGQSAVFSEWGCIIQKLNVRTPDGSLRDVVLGYDSLEEYLSDTRHFGATIGRYANRIAGGRFTLNGVTYCLPRNNGANTLHGGFKGFDKKLFTASPRPDGGVDFTCFSPDLEEGFPGNLTLTVQTSFRNGALRMGYRWTADKETPVSITNHSYFNLHGRGTVLDHRVTLRADRYCRADGGLVAQAPTAPVEGTPFDLRGGKTIFDGLLARSDELIRAGGGYDHCFEVAPGEGPVAIAEVGKPTVSFAGGLRMEVYSDLPAVQFYTGNKIGYVRGKGGVFYNSFDGFALECQHFPNAVNEPEFYRKGLVGREGAAFIEYRFV